MHELHMKKPSVKQCKSFIKTDARALIRQHFEKDRNSHQSSSIPPVVSRHATPDGWFQQLEAHTGNCMTALYSKTDLHNVSRPPKAPVLQD